MYTEEMVSTDCIVVKKLTQNVVDNAGYGFLGGQRWTYKGTEHTEAIAKGVSLGIRLGKKLKLRSEERNTKFSRLDSGKIDKRLISSLGFGAERIFQQVLTDRYTPANVHISIDASGSMAGSRFNNCQTAVVAIAKAASMIDNLDIQISYRTTTDASKPIILIAYDSRVDSFSKITSLFKHICASSLTPEGLTFEAIQNLLVEASGDRESYFINFSDGMPYAEPKGYNYYGDQAIQHTRKQVEEMRKKGIKVLSYFIGGGGYGKDDFTRMYGRSAESIDVTNLIPLAKTLNKMFLTK
jgi:nitric oxide reductase activation protein